MPLDNWPLHACLLCCYVHVIFLEKREIFKKARLPAHNDVDSDSDDQDITKLKEAKPSKKLVTNVKLQRKSSKHHSDRQTEYKVKVAVL